jgi:hypothetical protein
MNVSSYDIILGTPFLFDHKISMAFNETEITIGQIEANTQRGIPTRQAYFLETRTAHMRQENLDEIRTHLQELAVPLCKPAAETELPPI